MGRSRTYKWLIGIAIIAGAVGVLAWTQLSGNLVYFYTPDEAQASAATLQGKTIRVGGMVTPGTVQWNAEQLDLKFQISDLKGHDIQIAHKGVPPDMFKEGQGVVVEGRISDNGQSMASTKLMVKHSEEYKKPGDHQNVDKALLEKSIFK